MTNQNEDGKVDRHLQNGEFFVLSDTHFLHNNILEYEPIRKTTPIHVDRFMVDKWRETIKPEDTVLHLGDLALGKKEDFRSIADKLTGTKFMLKTGNHDKRSKTFYNEHGFQVIPEFTLMYKGWNIKFTHWPDDKHEWIKYPKHINVHGHVHSKTRDDRRMINLSVEVIGFTPLWLPNVLDERILELEN